MTISNEMFNMDNLLLLGIYTVKSLTHVHQDVGRCKYVTATVLVSAKVKTVEMHMPGTIKNKGLHPHTLIKEDF